jgi:hypothetical protein
VNVPSQESAVCTLQTSRRRFVTTATAAAIGVAVAGPRSWGASGPLLSRADSQFLADQARRVVNSARLDPGQTKGKWTNQTSYVLHVPGGNMGYPAYWVRDSVMMLESGYIQAGEIEGWIRCIAATLRNQDWQVRPEVVVPAFAVPDHIDLDGEGSFYPGSYETGTKQGGKPFGKYPPIDDQYYFLFAVYRHWKITGSTDLLKAPIKMKTGEMRLADLCEKVYRMAPCDAETALCTAGDIDTENAKDFGFCDSVFKSGKLLFPSILKYVAAQQLMELYRAAELPDRTASLESDVHAIRKAIPATFMHQWGPKNETWLDSATSVGNQPDVWGSAYAVYTGAVDEAIAVKIGRALARGYREKSAVRDGCVRNILSNDPANPNGWQKSLSLPGTYQNGGYWGTAAGWYLAALAKFDRAGARQMSQDFLGFLRKNRREDGTAESWEWFNPETGKHANPLYVATVGLPYGCLREVGLLDLPVEHG